MYLSCVFFSFGSFGGIDCCVSFFLLDLIRNLSSFDSILLSRLLSVEKKIWSGFRGEKFSALPLKGKLLISF